MPTKRELLIAAVAIVLLGTVGRLWYVDHHARAVAQTVDAAAKSIIAKNDSAIAARDSVAAKKDVVLEHEATNATKTPQAAAKALVTFMPADDQSPIAVVDKKDLPAPLQANLPDAPVALVPANQLEQLTQDEYSCAIARNDLTACKADVVDLHSELTAEATATNAWKAAANGGTKWQRFFHVLKLVGCGAGGAYVGGLIRSSTGAAVGAAAGVTGCSLF